MNLLVQSPVKKTGFNEDIYIFISKISVEPIFDWYTRCKKKWKSRNVCKNVFSGILNFLRKNMIPEFVYFVVVPQRLAHDLILRQNMNLINKLSYFNSFNMS